MPYETLLYQTAGALATITLNRPQRLNTIVPPMPEELEAAVHSASVDADVKVIVLRGAAGLSVRALTSARASTIGMRASPRPGSGTRARTSRPLPRRPTVPCPSS